MSPARRIGLFGGAFDPPHLAHAALARAAIEQLQLDEMLILPTGSAWHKAIPLSPGEHRLAMARLAFEGLPQARVDDRELRRDGPTYTIDTLREVQREHPGAQLVLVIGADQARAFDQWRESAEIARLAIISVAERAPEDESPGASRSVRLPGGAWTPLSLPLMPVSATEIRARVAAGEPIGHLVAPAVARYIDQHHLYQPAR